ncbi:MAG: 23S rRNA (guanosine(2251)-2'-O)-methyltransferase RlmB, partial [Caldilineaceae bacterium]
MSDLIIGRRAVLETLRARRRRAFRLWIEGAEGETHTGIVAEIVAETQAANVPIRYIKGGLFEKLAREQANAQGIALEAGDYPYVDLQAILSLAKRSGEAPLVLLLDHLQDPQNLGTLVRSAEAFGVHGILIPDRRAAGVTPAVSNASAGAVEHMLVAQVTNLNKAIDELKAAKLWVAGLDSAADAQPLARASLDGALALVVGSEGEGLSRLTRERCDFLVRIPMVGRVESLN